MTSTFWQLAIIRAAMGLANSLFTPLATRILGSLFDESSRGLTFGLFNFSVYLSFAVCLSLGTFMYDE
jgi:MFS family permease